MEHPNFFLQETIQRYISKVKDEAVRRRLSDELTLMKVKALYHAGSRDNLSQALALLQGTGTQINYSHLAQMKPHYLKLQPIL